MFKPVFTDVFGQLQEKPPDRPPRIKPNSEKDKLLNFGLLTARSGLAPDSTAGRVRRLSALNNTTTTDKRSWPLVNSLNTRVYCVDIDTTDKGEQEQIRSILAGLPTAFTFESYSQRPKALVVLDDPCLTPAEAIEEFQRFTGISNSTFSKPFDIAGLNAFYVHPRDLVRLCDWVKLSEIDRPIVSKRLSVKEDVKAPTPYPLPRGWVDTSYYLDRPASNIIRDFVIDFLTQYGQSDISTYKLAVTLNKDRTQCSKELNKLVKEGVIELVDASFSPGRKARTYRLPGVNVLPTAFKPTVAPSKGVNEDIYSWTNKCIRHAGNNGWDFDQLARYIEDNLGSQFDPSKLKSLRSRFENWLKKINKTSDK